MIVKYTNTAWEVITQRAHGMLAGQICAAWTPPADDENWFATLIATTEHDDVYNELLGTPLIDKNGAPINFKATSFDPSAASMQMEMALSKSRFIALLTAKHIDFTHGKDAKAKAFLNGLKPLQKQWLKEAKVGIKDVDRAYELLEFCDAFSLLICQGEIPPENRRLEISSGPDGTVFFLHQQETAIIVEPWPFNTREFCVRYETRTIEKLKFKNDTEFREALKEAKVTLKELKISGKPAK